MTGPLRRRGRTAGSPACDTLSPADRYQELFVAVQETGVFADCKTFVDCAPRTEPGLILQDYRARQAEAGFDLPAFVAANFEAPQPRDSGFRSLPGQTMAAHIDALWPYLQREPAEHPPRGSALPLPHPYVVPGGRFGELYYWDSFFTMLGLSESGLPALVHAMTDNFAWLIDTYGHVPNGTRTYYLSRSQPPVFALMTRLCENKGGPLATAYLPQLRREHAFWMDGEDAVRPGAPHRRVVALAGGTVLNRYWDDRCSPREESWREDRATAALSNRPAPEVYRHLRAAAESGWDFSSRWLAEDASGQPGRQLASIVTTDLLPVDLNAFMYTLEQTISELSAATGEARAAREFGARASRRADAINRVFWDAGAGFYVDYDWRRRQRRRCLTAATTVPLYCGVASQERAQSVAQAVCARLLAPGGLRSSECASGQQWDSPNGWAPLQWLAAEGFARYGLDALAADIRSRWLATVQEVFGREGKLVEKYALRPSASHPAAGGGGGEYPLQDGFGWTNGVVRRWLHETGGS